MRAWLADLLCKIAVWLDPKGFEDLDDDDMIEIEFIFGEAPAPSAPIDVSWRSMHGADA
jgi:hypothetical protein